MKLKSPVFFILILISSASCFAQQDGDTAKFRREIPRYQDGKPDLFYELTQQKVSQLKIDSLQNGYDSLQIRIWYDYSLMNLRKLLVIKRTDSAWTAIAYTMQVEWDAGSLTEKVTKTVVDTLTPKNGWNSFLPKLFALQITTLPNMDNIPGLIDGWTDGITYNVEVATKDQYRFYGYHLPGEFQDTYWQAKNMVNILQLIEVEFGIKSDVR